jgi:hypothetical protein
MVSVFPHHWSSQLAAGVLSALPQNVSSIHSPEPEATPKYDYYVYFGNFRIISVVALQNVLFLLRIASEFGFLVIRSGAKLYIFRVESGIFKARKI